jgi:hypothetical protein
MRVTPTDIPGVTWRFLNSWELRAALVCILLLAVYFTGGWARTLVHFIVNQVCVGVSSGKIVYALLFAAAVLARTAWLARHDEHIDSQSNAPSARGASAPPTSANLRIFAICTALGLAASLASCILYLRAMGLSLGTVSFHWRDGVNSVNALTHIHTSKAPIALVVDWLGHASWHQRFDTGFAYLRAVPVWLAIVIGVCFLASIASALWQLPRVARGYTAPRERLVVAIVLALAGGAITKSVLDGGPLAYDTIAALLALALLAGPSSLAQAASRARRFAAGPVLLLAVWLGTVAVFAPGGTLRQGSEWLQRASLYTLILACGAAITPSSQRPKFTLIALSGVTWIIFVSHACTVRVLPLMRTAPPQVRVFERDGTTRTEPSRNQSAAQVYLRLGDNPQRARRVQFAPREDRVTGLYADIIPLRSDREITLAPGPLVFLRRADMVPSDMGRGPARLRSQVAFDAHHGPVLFSEGARDQIAENDRFVAYFVIDDHFRRSGLLEYVLVPYVQFRDDAATDPSAEITP